LNEKKARIFGSETDEVAKELLPQKHLAILKNREA
jgi:hypothetical protein